MCIKHNTGKIAQNNSSQLICMDILIMKDITKETRCDIFWFILRTPQPQSGAFLISNFFSCFTILVQRCAQNNSPWEYLIKKGKLKTCPSQKLNWEVITKISHLKTNSNFYQCTRHCVTAWKGHITPNRQEANWCCCKPCNRN